MNKLLLALSCLGLGAFAAAQEPAGQPIRIGMIGLDTSHVPGFVNIFNNAKAAGDLAGFKIVAGYPGGTDWPASRDRVARFTEQVRSRGVEIVDSIPALLAKVDVVMLESVDGRIHLQEAIPVIKARKPLWIDKPVAGSLADAIAIFELAKQHGVPVFSSSPVRFTADVRTAPTNDAIGPILGAATWGSCSHTPGTPDLFFYGIHGVEPLFVFLGAGCATVSRAATENADIVTGVWKDGRVGTYRGIHKGKAAFGATIFGAKSIAQTQGGTGMEELSRAIARFFKTRRSPVSQEETIEIFAFMEAADESKRQGGAAVALADVLSKARTAAAAKLGH